MSQFTLTPSAGGHEGLFHYQREFLERDRIINLLTAAGCAKCGTLPCHHSLDCFSYLGFVTFSFLLCVQENKKSQINQSTTKINPKLSMWMLSGEGGREKNKRGKGLKRNMEESPVESQSSEQTLVPT